MRQLFLLVLASLACACGHRSIIDLSDAKATRQSDDRVSVTENATCKTMVGGSECGSLCVTATWISSTGSTVDAVTACDPTVLVNGSRKAFSHTSKIPIPPTAGARLRVDATSTHASPWQTVAYDAPSP
jgi:hypothetical protein